MRMIEDIDYILSHFGEPLFPRKMMTFKSNGQFTVNSKEEIFIKCKEANFVDCRINAYPEYTEYKGIIRYSPNFVFIDLDLANFSNYKEPRKMLDKTLNKTVQNISSVVTTSRNQSNSSEQANYNQNEQTLNKKQIHDIKDVQPTVLWTGNGYHVYLPMQAIILDGIDIFSKDKYPNLFSNYNCKYSNYSVSELFLKFAENFFTGGKADPQHHPKYKTCLIRIPNTLNSKCLAKDEESTVKIVHKWNGIRLSIQLLTTDFWRWLTQEEIDQRILNKKNKNLQRINVGPITDNFSIQWIEDLLQRGIEDRRKETLRLILGPYLAKRKSHDEAFIILQEWLDKCNKVKPLDKNFNQKQRIESSLKNTKGFLILENVKVKYKELYDYIR